MKRVGLLTKCWYGDCQERAIYIVKYAGSQIAYCKIHSRWTPEDKFVARVLRHL